MILLMYILLLPFAALGGGPSVSVTSEHSLIKVQSSQDSRGVYLYTLYLSL